MVSSFIHLTPRGPPTPILPTPVLSCPALSFFFSFLEYITKPLNTSRLLQSSTPLIRHRLSESRHSPSPFPAGVQTCVHRLTFHISRILRREPELTQFETAQIANLCPADAEEAKSIIPRCALRSMVSFDPTLTYFMSPPVS